MSYITERNAERAATKKQLWALYCLTKKDYRNEGLTMLDASKLIAQLNENKGANKVVKVAKAKPSIEQEFISYMTEKLQGVIAICKDAIKIKSVVEDDPTIFTDESKRQKYAFFGFGCGISIIKFDKRSKLGKVILELSSKHRNTTFLNVFLKGFTTKQITYFENVGFPLQAMYNQDIRIGAAYESAVAEFMRSKGVKKVCVRTYDD